MPVPSINVPLKKVVAFKRKREDELRNFKNLLLEAEKNLIKADSIEEKKIELLQFSNNLKKGVDDIKKLLGDSKIDLALNSFSSLLDVKQPEIFGSLSSAGVGGAAAAIAACPLVGLGAAAVILLGTTVSSAFRIKREVANSAYSYVYHAQQEGILK